MSQSLKSIQNETYYIIGVALAAAAGSLATAQFNKANASIPDSNNKINACYRTKGGDLRVLDTATTDTCSNQETAINWDQSTAPKYAKVYLNTQGELDATKNENILSFAAADTTISSNIGYCLDLAITPTFFVSTRGLGSGVVIKGDAEFDPNGEEFPQHCSTQYDVFVADGDISNGILFY